MKTVTQVLAGVVAALVAIFQVPAVQSAVMAFFTAHPSIASVVGGLAAILALFHQPASSPTAPVAGAK